METACKVSSSVLVLFFLELCNALPINLENSGPDSHTQFLTGLVAVLLTVCSVVLLAGCLCCHRKNGFKEFRDSPVAASVANSLDHGHINPIANSEFTIFTPISPPHHNNNVFLANQRIVSRTQDDYKYGDIDVTYWFDGSEEDFPRKNLKYIKELGKGWFGRVVEGTAQGLSKNPEEWCPVAVRILEASASSRERVLFLYDATIYRCGSHPNILRVLGRSLDTIPLLLLQEYYTEGDLKRYLRNNRATCEKFLSSDYPLLWCYQLTSAVKFLHSCRVTHPDLAARNCQLTKDLQLKLGDYGLSATLYPEDYYEGAPAIPLRWCAPETISYTSTTIQLKQITFEGNVWSLGVTLWEICECGDQPYSWLTDDEVVSQVIETPKVRLPRPSYSTIYTDYLYRLMQSCWSTVESRASIYQIELMLADLMQVYEHTKVISYGEEEASVSMHDFDKRWEALKPNKSEEQDLRSLNALNLHVGNVDEILNEKRLSASMNNLHGSLDNLLEYKNSFDPMESWLENVACNTGDMSYVKGLSEAIKDLDNAIAFENVSSDSSHQQSPIPDVIPRQNKLQFKLGQVFKPSFSELTQNEQRATSSESETEDEAWRKKIERGAYSEKVRQKSRSVTDLMVLTHIDCSESDSETTMPSIDYNYKTNHRNMRYIKNMENSSLKFGSEGNLLSVQDTFQEELRKLQEERRDSLLFVPDNRSQSSSSVGDVTKVTRDLPNVVAANSSPVKKLFEELNSPVDIVPAKQVYNVFNVSVEQKYSSLCPVQNLSAPELKTANQINKIKKTSNASDNNCLITPENTDDNKCLLNNSSEITTPANLSIDVPEINTSSEVTDNNGRVDVCNICSAVNSESDETRVNNKKVENLICFADTDRNYNQIKQNMSLRSQHELIKTWLSEDIFSINEEEMANNKFKAENEELIKRENSHNLKRDCANFLTSQLHSVDPFDYEIKHQVPKLVDIIQNNIKLLDYIIINDKENNSSNYCELKQVNQTRIFQQKSISIEDNEHIQYHTSDEAETPPSLNFNDEGLQDKHENKIFNNRNYDVSKMHEERTLSSPQLEKFGDLETPEIKLEDIQLTEVVSLNDLNHKFVPITNDIDGSNAPNVQPNEPNLGDERNAEIQQTETEIKEEQSVKCFDMLKLTEIALEKVKDLDLGFIQIDDTKQIQKVDLDSSALWKVSALNDLNISRVDLDTESIIAKDEMQSKNPDISTLQEELITPKAPEIQTKTSNESGLENLIETASTFNDALNVVVDLEKQQLDSNEINVNISKDELKEIPPEPTALQEGKLNKIEEERQKIREEENETKSDEEYLVLRPSPEGESQIKESQGEDLNESAEVESNRSRSDSATDGLNQTESGKVRHKIREEESEVKSDEEDSVLRPSPEGESQVKESQGDDLNERAEVELNRSRSDSTTDGLNQTESGEVRLINEANYEHLRQEGEINFVERDLEKMKEISDSFIKEERKVNDSNFTKPSEFHGKVQGDETDKERNQTVNFSRGEPPAKIEQLQNALFDGLLPLKTVDEEETTKSKTEQEEDTNETTNLNTTKEVKEIEDDSNFSKDAAISNTPKEKGLNILEQETTLTETAEGAIADEMVQMDGLTLKPDDEEMMKSKRENEENANMKEEGDANLFKEEPNLNTTEEKDFNVLQQETAKEANEMTQVMTVEIKTTKDNLNHSTLNAEEEEGTIKTKTKKEEAHTNKLMILSTANVVEDDSNLFKEEPNLNTMEEKDFNILQQETVKEANANVMTEVVEIKTTEDNSNLFNDVMTLNAEEEEGTTKAKTEKEEANTNNLKILNTANEAEEVEGDSNLFKEEPNLSTMEDSLQQETAKEASADEITQVITVDVKKTENNLVLLNDVMTLNADEEEGTTKAKTEKEEANTNKLEILNTSNEAKQVEDDLNLFKEEPISSTTEEDKGLNILLQQETTSRTEKEDNPSDEMAVNNLNLEVVLNSALKEEATKTGLNEQEDTNKMAEANVDLSTAVKEEEDILQKRTAQATPEENTNEVTVLKEHVEALNPEELVKLERTEFNNKQASEIEPNDPKEEENLNVLQKSLAQTTTEEKEANTNEQKEVLNSEIAQNDPAEENTNEVATSKEQVEVSNRKQPVQFQRNDSNSEEVSDDPVSLTQVRLEIEKVSSTMQPKHDNEASKAKTPNALLDKDTELEKLTSEISLNKTKGLDTSSEKIIDKLTQIIKAEKQQQHQKQTDISRDFLINEVRCYAGGQEKKQQPQVQFDLSENQQEISPNSLTHYSVFAGTPGMKQRSLDSIVILGASDDYSIDYYSGLKTSTEEADELQFSSNFVQDGAQKPFRLRTSDVQDHSDMKYSLETWDNFLDKTFDDQNSRSTDFSNFSEEPQSLLFLETENYEVKGKGGTVRNEPSPKRVKKDEKAAEDLNVSVKNQDVKSEDVKSEDVQSEDVKSEDKQSQKECDSDGGSWEAEGGWFLHPQTSSEEPTGQIAPCTSESYVGFSMDDEIMTALRNELLNKLPHAQRASNDKVEDPEELDDPSEKNEVFVRYNVYSTPLSPIPEETYVDSDEESRCATPQRYDSSDDDSDWSIQDDNNSPYNRTETHSPKLTESPVKEPLNRHTPSQDSCCSNDTLFNLEELNAANNDHEKAADIAVKIENETEQGVEENSDSQDLTVNNEEPLPNNYAKSFNVPKINYIQEFLNNERCSGDFKPEENKSEGSTTNSDVYLSVNENTFTFGQSVAPLNSPEDKPWKELQASFRQCEEDEMIEDKDILEALNESDQSNDGNEVIKRDDEEEEETDNTTEYASVEDLKNKINLSVVVVEETKVGSEVVNDDLDSSSDVDDTRPKVLESSSDSCDDMYGPLTDIRFSGPANMELMTTSFNEGTDLMEEQDWDSGSDSRSSSSGEFIWREGEHEASVKALRAAPQSENLNNVAPMEHIQEECESSSCTSDSETEECPEFVPSAWDKYATPTKSALRSPEKSLERTETGKKSKAVWFKKQKYHCVYEYPREPESPLLQSYDLWQPTPDYSTIADWDLDGNSYLPTTLDDPDCTSQDYEVKSDQYPKNLYHLTTFPDLTMGTTMLDEDFFISSSSRPFDMLGGLTSQFFPGKQFLDNWNENVTPDSGMEDVIPVASLTDDKEARLQSSQVPSLKSLAAAVAKQNENRNTVLGGLRHTRNKLKLDLPPSPSAFTSSRSFTVEPVEEILNRQAPTFTTFGKSRFQVQQVDTTLDDDKQSKNVSFEAIPYKPATQFYKNDYFDREKHKVEIVKGEASLLDSADEDSGIESCTLERKKGVDV